MYNPFNQAKRVENIDPKLIVVLLRQSPVKMTGEQRTAMTVSCRDSDLIPKVPEAGKIYTEGNVELQLMHNGIKVVRGCYHGDWMENIIKTLKGHHEPQEEKAFYEILQRLGPGSTMVELGCFWAYYSLWFNDFIDNAINYCIEPDPTNLAIGKENAKINNKNMYFMQNAAGDEHGSEITIPLDSDPTKTVTTKIASVDGLVQEKNLTKIDLLHMDIQGVELDALKGAEASIRNNLIRFVVVSTHHYMFSKDPMTHTKCIEFLGNMGGHIIVAHSVLESYSGDGLIVASFDERDKDFYIDVSNNRADSALFRTYEEDLSILFEHDAE